MDHYETLGVERGATAEEIKAAWRRASSQAHPDRAGGSAERQQAVNKAYEVLSDAERRAAYDAGGSDNGIEDEARARLMALFAKAVNDGANDILDHLRGALDHQQLLQEAQLELGAREVKRLQASLKKVRRKDGGESLVDALITKRIGDVNDTMAQMRHALAVIKRCWELVDEYETAPEDMQQLHITFRSIYV